MFKRTLQPAVRAALMFAVVVCAAPSSFGQAASPTAASPAATDPAALVTRYCTTCHNARLKTADLVLDPAQIADIGKHAETWEKVVRKLRSGAMPPSGAPRPPVAQASAAVASLEASLDKAAAATPQSGKMPLLHRLTRTEYANSVRDLLDLGPLPSEIDYQVLLPADNSASGFDNLADLLFMSPTVMERYLDAARKLSRFAVGDPNAPVMASTYKISPEQWQDGHVDELPFGTRGGTAIHAEIPLDGEYLVKVDIANAGRDDNRLEITVDGESVASVGLAAGGSKPREIRLALRAGPRLIGVTFAERNEARDEATLKPRFRGRGTQPAVASILITGPTAMGAAGDTPSRRHVIVCHPASDSEAPACARQILSTLLRRAYRHPVEQADLDGVMSFYDQGRAEGGFELGIQRALERILVSPQFLFRMEREPTGAKPGSIFRVNDLELASRLSFALWSSIPDDRLLDQAIAGKLKDPAVYQAEVKRMLADPRSESMVDNFAAQWLFLRDVDAKIPDETLYPNFDETLRQSFRAETELFLDSVLREDRSVLELLSANYTFVNGRLAQHYGIPNIEGSRFRRVLFPAGSPRGGLLGQGSVLTITSYAARTSPVVRGKWVLENLLSAAPPPPPPNVPALKTESDTTGKTLNMRAAMEQHRAAPACAGCHARMDPIGFALENFDAIGRYRERDNDEPINAAGVMPDGTKIDGVAGLKKALLSQPDEFVTTVSERFLMYALGRNLQYYDAPAVRRIVRDAKQDGYKFSTIVASAVRSDAFQTRLAVGN